MIALVVEIHFEHQADLFEIGKADGKLASLFGSGERGQEQRGENGDDCDDDQQFDQCEGAAQFHPAISVGIGVICN